MSSLIQPSNDVIFEAWKNAESHSPPDMHEIFHSSMQNGNSLDIVNINDFRNFPPRRDNRQKTKGYEILRRPSGGQSESQLIDSQYAENQQNIYNGSLLSRNEEKRKFDPDNFFCKDSKLPFTNVMDRINCNDIFSNNKMEGDYSNKQNDEVDGSGSNLMSIFNGEKQSSGEGETSKLAAVFSSLSVGESRPNQNSIHTTQTYMKYHRPPVFSGEFPKAQTTSQQSTPEIEYLAHNLLSLASFRSESRNSFEEHSMRFFEHPPPTSKPTSPSEIPNSDLFNPEALFSLPKWSTGADDMAQFREPPPSLSQTPLPPIGHQKESLGDFLCEPPPLPVRPTSSPPSYSTSTFFQHEQKEQNNYSQHQVPAPIITVITSSFPQDHRVGFPKTWAGLGQCYVSRLPIPWTLIHTDDQPPGGPWMQAFDSAKVRFVCKGCSAGWTSMRGKIAFWHRVDNEAGVAVGLLFYRVFGQKCSKCLERKYMEGLELDRFEDPMWYPEEIKKVLINVLQKIGHIYYGYARPHLNDFRRGGKPRTPHQPDRCQACAVNLCREGISVYTRRPPPNGEQPSS